MADLGASKSEAPRLTVGAINFEVIQNILAQYFNITNRYGQTTLT